EVLAVPKLARWRGENLDVLQCRCDAVAIVLDDIVAHQGSRRCCLRGAHGNAAVAVADDCVAEDPTVRRARTLAHNGDGLPVVAIDQIVEDEYLRRVLNTNARAGVIEDDAISDGEIVAAALEHDAPIHSAGDHEAVDGPARHVGESEASTGGAAGGVDDYGAWRITGLSSCHIGDELQAVRCGSAGRGGHALDVRSGTDNDLVTVERALG